MLFGYPIDGLHMTGNDTPRHSTEGIGAFGLATGQVTLAPT